MWMENALLAFAKSKAPRSHAKLLLHRGAESDAKSLKSGDALAVITDVEKPVRGCRRISLGVMGYMAVASAELFENHFSKGVSLDTIENTPCLAFDRKDTIQDQWMGLCFGKSAQTANHMVPSYEGYVACCLNGTAWGLVPGVAGLPYLASGELIELVPNKRIHISLHWQSSTQSSEILRQLGEIVFEEAQIHLLPDNVGPKKQFERNCCRVLSTGHAWPSMLKGPPLC